MKRIVYFFVMSFVLFGMNDVCFSDTTPPIVIKFGHILNVDHAVDKSAKLMAKLAAERSGGKIKIEVFPGSQLGGERQLIEGAKLGTVDMGECGSGMLGQFIKPYYINTMLYVYRDEDHLHKVMWGKIGQEMADELLKFGVRIITPNWDRGARHLITTKPVYKVEDLKGVKLRVPESPIYLESWKALGARPTPVSFAEIFTSLKLGVIEGLEMSYASYYLQRFHEVAKYSTETSHVIECSMIFMSEKLFKKIPPQYQKIIIDSARDAGDWERKEVIEDLNNYKKKLIESGVTMIPTDKALWQGKLKQEGVYEKLAHIWGGDKELFNRIQKVK